MPNSGGKCPNPRHLLTAAGGNDPAAAPNRTWRDRDLAHVWHPCTQMKDHDALLPMIPIRRGAGAWLTTSPASATSMPSVPGG